MEEGREGGGFKMEAELGEGGLYLQSKPIRSEYHKSIVYSQAPPRLSRPPMKLRAATLGRFQLATICTRITFHSTFLGPPPTTTNHHQPPPTTLPRWPRPLTQNKIHRSVQWVRAVNHESKWGGKNM